MNIGLAIAFRDNENGFGHWFVNDIQIPADTPVNQIERIAVNKFWHMDYLTASHMGEVINIWVYSIDGKFQNYYDKIEEEKE